MSRTAEELSKYLSANLCGDASAKISGVASPARAAAGDLIYLDSPKHLSVTEKSAARCVVARPGTRISGKTILETAEPKFAFAKAAALLLAPEKPHAGVHPTAIVASTARVAASASVGPYAVIEEDVEIGESSAIDAFCFLGRGAHVGENSKLHPRVTLYAGARIGNRVEVHSGAVIGSDGFGYVFGEGRFLKFPQVGSVEIGDDAEIGCNTTIDRGSLDATQIGAGVKIDNLVQVAHNVRVGEHSILAAQVGISGSAILGKNVIVGGQAGLGERCTVSDGASIGGQAGILPGKIVPAKQIVWGTPARSLEKFKEQHSWFGRLPELAERVRKLENVGPKDSSLAK